MNNNNGQYIELEKGKIYGIPLTNGYLRIDVSQDLNYPGVNIEFISNKESNLAKTNPRVLFEENVEANNELRVLVWANQNNEDYTDKITFYESKDY